MSCPYDIALSRLESGGLYVNQQALPNEHLPAAQSPKGGQVLNRAGSPAGWQKYFAFLEEQ